MTRYYDGAARWARFDAMTPEQRELERADDDISGELRDRAAFEDYAEALERKALERKASAIPAHMRQMVKSTR